MCDEAGKPTGKTHTLAKGEDPKVIAGRLRRSVAERAGRVRLQSAVGLRAVWCGLNSTAAEY